MQIARFQGVVLNKRQRKAHEENIFAESIKFFGWLIDAISQMGRSCVCAKYGTANRKHTSERL